MTDRLDYYSGYEGEPEIIFELIKNNNIIKTVHIWDGHLLFIVEKAVKTDVGWKGIAGAYYNGDMDDICFQSAKCNRRCSCLYNRRRLFLY